MWQSHSEKRLVAWADLRNSCKENPNLDEVITIIHNWWQQAPMVLRYLHCDLVDDWPDPWDLIAENTYCSLAKCLMYISATTTSVSNNRDTFTMRLVPPARGTSHSDQSCTSNRVYGSTQEYLLRHND